MQNYQSKLILPGQVDEYRGKGYNVVDFHLHSSASYDVFNKKSLYPRVLRERMLKQGWDYVTFTDHDTIDAYDGLDLEGVIKGVEVTIKPRIFPGYEHPHTMHVNVYALSDEQFAEIDAIAKQGDFFGLIDYLKNEELPYQLNHPFISGYYEEPEWHHMPEIVQYFDVLEITNTRRSRLHNESAGRLADAFGLGWTEGSDNHIGLPVKGTLVRGADFGEMWDRIKAGDVLTVPEHMDYRTMKQTVQAYASIVFNMTPEELENFSFRFKSEDSKTDRFIDYVMTERAAGSRLFNGVPGKIVENVLSNLGPLFTYMTYVRKQNRIGKEILEMVDGVVGEVADSVGLDFRREV